MLDESIRGDFAVVPQVKTLVASTATQLSTQPTNGARGVLLRADPISNSEAIYIGYDNAVTNLVKWTAILMPLDPTILIQISDASKLWLFSTGTNQKVGWSVL